ncbi:uncharacterized protein LOC127711740 [Mytilus californianus]|uniref:uncharacterized protein LOC127711740 n=1 Tax=Mytilus californianus TaxID=6549 RepID=UPI002245F89C|nr:uncharacterized protein LOC127711740 [Mytilus californianus]
MIIITTCLSCCFLKPFTSFTEQSSPSPNVVPPAVCEVPFNCPSENTIACPQEGSIPKECTGTDTTTTDKITTTTLAQSTTITSDTPTTTTLSHSTTTTSHTLTTTSLTQSTTTTADNPTTTRAKKPCGLNGRLHRHGQ